MLVELEAKIDGELVCGAGCIAAEVDRRELLLLVVFVVVDTGVVWFSVLVLRLLLFCLSPVRLVWSIVASRKWAKEWWVIANAQCTGVSLVLHTMLLQVCASPSWAVLHLTVGAVHSLVLLVHIGLELLDPQHVVCIFVTCVLADILVD